jgi:hypothetical protein
MPNSLSNYDVTFIQNGLLGTWHWTAKQSPDGAVLSSFGLFVSKASAEVDALRQIERHEARETINAAQLRRRIAERATKPAPPKKA